MAAHARPRLALPQRRLARLRLVIAVACGATGLTSACLMSQAVAIQRDRIAALDHRLDSARAAYAEVATEYHIRSGPDAIARMGIVPLALRAPYARQYLTSVAQLATLARPARERIELAVR